MNMWFLICIGVFILFGLVLIAALRRGTRAVRNGLKEQAARIDQEDGTGEANTRWARGDTGPSPQTPKKIQAMVSCTACGGENPAGASVCTYCRRRL